MQVKSKDDVYESARLIDIPGAQQLTIAAVAALLQTTLALKCPLGGLGGGAGGETCAEGGGGRGGGIAKHRVRSPDGILPVGHTEHSPSGLM